MGATEHGDHPVGPILPGSRVGRGHSGFHSGVPLRDSWAGFGKGLPSGVVWGLHLPGCSCQQLGASYTLTSTQDVCHWVSAAPCKGPAGCRQPPLQRRPLPNAVDSTVRKLTVHRQCAGAGGPQRTTAWGLSSRSSGLPGETRGHRGRCAETGAQKSGAQGGAICSVCWTSEATFLKVER